MPRVKYNYMLNLTIKFSKIRNQKFGNSKCWYSCEEQRSQLLMGVQIDKTLWKLFFSAIEMLNALKQSQSTSQSLSWKIHTHAQKTCKRSVTVLFLGRIKIWKEYKCLSWEEGKSILVFLK